MGLSLLISAPMLVIQCLLALVFTGGQVDGDLDVEIRITLLPWADNFLVEFKLIVSP